MIPRTIHYCWFGRNPLPNEAERCIESWGRACSGYAVRRWDEDSFDVDACRFAREAYAAGRWAFVADYARLRIIFEHGGIYLDTDVELLSSLDELLGHEAFFGFQHDRAINTGLGFGAVAGHPLVGDLMRAYEQAAFLDAAGRPDTTPCPARDAQAFVRHGFQLDGTLQERKGVVVLPADYLSPKSYETGRIALTARTIAIHHYAASWHSPVEAADIRKRRFYGRILGEALGRVAYRLEWKVRNAWQRLRRSVRSPR